MSDPYEGVRQPAPELAGLKPQHLRALADPGGGRGHLRRQRAREEVYVERFDDRCRWSLVHKGGAYPLLRVPRRSCRWTTTPGHRLPHGGRRVHRARRVPRGRAGALNAPPVIWCSLEGTLPGDAVALIRPAVEVRRRRAGAASPPDGARSVRRRGCGCAAGAASPPAARSSTDCNCASVSGDPAARLCRSSGSAVRLCSSKRGSAGGAAKGFAAHAVLGVPLVEPLVVVVELPELGAPPSPVGSAAITDSMLDGLRDGLERLAVEDVALGADPVRRRPRS